MKYPNAYAGVSKILTAQILKMIGSVCMIIGGIAALVLAATLAVALGEEGAEAVAAGSGLVTVLFMVAGGVLAIIAYILNIVGLRQAGKDEDSFDSGFVVAIFALIISVATAIFSAVNLGGGIADNISQTISYICEIFIIFCVINGIGNLAVELGNEKLANTGRRLFIIVCLMVILSAIANLIPAFFGANPVFQAIQGGLSITSGILSIVGYIIYIIYLAKGKKMLKNS